MGLSLGGSKPFASACYDWNYWSKAILVVVMIVGRTREFPENLDGALQLVKAEDLTKGQFLRGGEDQPATHRERGENEGDDGDEDEGQGQEHMREDVEGGTRERGSSQSSVGSQHGETKSGQEPFAGEDDRNTQSSPLHVIRDDTQDGDDSEAT